MQSPYVTDRISPNKKECRSIFLLEYEDISIADAIPNCEIRTNNESFFIAFIFNNGKYIPENIIENTIKISVLSSGRIT